MSSSGEMKMSLSEMTCVDEVRNCIGAATRIAAWTNIFVLQVLQQLELSVCPLCQHRCAEGLHNLLDGDILVCKLIPRRAVGS